MAIFGATRFLDPDVEDWCLETWGWLMTNLGGMERLRRIPLAAPTHEFFPPTAAQGHERALYLFDRVKSLMGMADCPCVLEEFGRPAIGRQFGFFTKLQGADTHNGALRIENGNVIISYTVDLVAHPTPLIVTFAHQLAHYQLSTVKKPIPGGRDLYELAAELTLAFDGFALFGAAGAFRSGPPVLGLGGPREASFSEPIWAFVLALFAALREIEVPSNQLKQNVAHLSRQAARYLKRHESLIAPLRGIA
jgi:hypothetical protein